MARKQQRGPAVDYRRIGSLGARRGRCFWFSRISKNLFPPKTTLSPWVTV